jgi:hypothetical protein
MNSFTTRFDNLYWTTFLSVGSAVAKKSRLVLFFVIAKSGFTYGALTLSSLANSKNTFMVSALAAIVS